jgi:F0F1-type ATP synthase assembly protein I
VSDGAQGHEPHTPSEQENDQLKNLPSVFALLTMGTTVAFIIGVFVVLGIWADRAWGTAPWGLLIGIALGTVAAVVSVVKQVRRFL